MLCIIHVVKSFLYKISIIIYILNPLYNIKLYFLLNFLFIIFREYTTWYLNCFFVENENNSKKLKGNNKQILTIYRY